jgi:hypothetical protein
MTIRLRQVAMIGILITFVLGLYSCYLRFTTQKEYFAWLWNCSPEVQYISGWMAFIGFTSCYLIYLANSLEEK